MLGDLDRGLRVQSGDGQPFVDQPVAVARPHPERVTGLVADRVFGQPKYQLPHILCRLRPAQLDVAGHVGDQRMLLGVPDRCGPVGRPSWRGNREGGRRRAAVPADRRRRGGQRLHHPAQPLGRSVLVVGFAVDPVDDAGRSQLGEALVEFAPVTAEIVVVGVAQRENGVAGVGESWCAVGG